MPPRQERRIHKIFVTRNTEYHLRRDRCVGVRDRRTGTWRDDHEALYRRVAAAVALMSNGSITARRELPEAGESLLFEGSDGAMTSPVISIERPPFEMVVNYPGPSVAGS